MKMADAITGDDAASVEVTASVTEVSDILVIDLPETTDAGTHVLSISLGDWDTFAAANLPADHTKFAGTHMLNYDVSDIDGQSVTLAIGTTPITLVRGSTDGLKVLTGPDFIPGDATTTGGVEFGALYDEEGPLKTLGADASVEITFVVTTDTVREGEYSIILDLFAFGLADADDPTSNVNDAIYRLELTEDGSNSSDFVGTLEYIGLNQMNILDADTHTAIAPISDAIILISDDSSISVEYRDLDIHRWRDDIHCRG